MDWNGKIGNLSDMIGERSNKAQQYVAECKLRRLLTKYLTPEIKQEFIDRNIANPKDIPLDMLSVDPAVQCINLDTEQLEKALQIHQIEGWLACMCFLAYGVEYMKYLA